MLFAICLFLLVLLFASIQHLMTQTLEFQRLSALKEEVEIHMRRSISAKNHMAWLDFQAERIRIRSKIRTTKYLIWTISALISVLMIYQAYTGEI